MTSKFKNDRYADDGVAPYEVGYGRPPVASRFKKGQSGNPNGRPRMRAKAVGELVLAALDNPVTVSIGGREKTIVTAEALLINQVNRAIKGEPKPLRAVKKLLEKTGMLQRVDDPSHPTGAVFVTEKEYDELHRYPERAAEIVHRAREREAKKGPPITTARLSADE
jgi:Family of unknown function (DUF5681)